MACASYPAVLKADGLAAGKGVIIAADRGRGRGPRSTSSSSSARFGEAEPRSWSRSSSRARSCRCSRSATARTAVPMAPAQDYKRIGDGDEGPNTGGMGSYSPVPGFDGRARARRSRATVHQPVVDELRRRGTPYRGSALRGADDDRRRAAGARVQLPLRRPRDPGGAAAAALRPARRCWSASHARRGPRRAASSSGRRSGRSPSCSPHAATPSPPAQGDVISGPATIDSLDVEVTHAGTAMRGRRDRHRRRPRTERHRRSARPPPRPRERAYRAVEAIEFDGAQYSGHRTSPRKCEAAPLEGD